MTDKPAVVVQAYKRKNTLDRLLTSLDQASYPSNTALIISIDHHEDDLDRQGVEAVTQLAGEFVWRHGDKQVISHPTRLGLVAHSRYCQSLTERFGSIILLEDDLVVSPTFYQYATAALETYRADSRIAGVSLNAHWYNGFTRQPFIPLPDAFDVFFLQLGTPQGQLYTEEQWLLYRDWLSAVSSRGSGKQALHQRLAALPSTDWLPIRDLYLIESGRSYVYPRESQTVNFGDVGTHFQTDTDFFQVPLQQRRDAFAFATLDESLAVYDSFFEIEPNRLKQLAPRLADYDFDVDLYATKKASQAQHQYVVTTRPVRHAVWTVGKWYRPLEANLFGEGTPGRDISLARWEDVDMSRRAELATRHDNNRYFNPEVDSNLPVALAERIRMRWQKRLGR